MLGVCLGHQAIAVAFGAKVEQAPEIFHGKQTLIFHNRKGLFQGMPLPFLGGRYHSLAVFDPPSALIVDAYTPDGTIMAMHHSIYPIYGVQFHPESILTPEGERLLHNFLKEVERCATSCKHS
jgi:anthranilate synthase/aminodeoxychorismate synthase-like glutamine amidotransferase